MEFFRRLFRGSPKPSNPPVHEPPPDVKPKLMDTPWRKTPVWTEQFQQTLKQENAAYEPLLGKYSKILLLGPIGVGKSSFINTIASVYAGYVVQQLATGKQGESITTGYKEHGIRFEGNRSKLKFLLCDTRGQCNLFTLSEEEFGYIIHGNVPDDYTYNPEKKLSPETPYFRKEPLIEQIPQCVCLTFDVNKLLALTTKMKNLFQAFMKTLRSEGIPHIILLTMVDRACPKIEKDLSNVYKSIAFKKAVDDIHETYGVSLNCIVPVKNYSVEHELDDNVDILALLALRQMLRACNDCLSPKILT